MFIKKRKIKIKFEFKDLRFIYPFAGNNLCRFLICQTLRNLHIVYNWVRKHAMSKLITALTIFDLMLASVTQYVFKVSSKIIVYLICIVLCSKLLYRQIWKYQPLYYSREQLETKI